MPKVKANGLEFEYEAFGDHANPPLLLVMGLGAQMTTWPEPFCLMPAAPEVVGLILKPPPRDREGLIQHGIELSRVIWGPRYFDEERARTTRTAAVDRAVSIEGTARQAGAAVVRRSRRAALAGLKVPALVIHGDADPLVPFENGKRTAAAIPGARLLVLPEVGHDLPPAFYETVADAIAEVASSSPAREAAPAS